MKIIINYGMIFSSFLQGNKSNYINVSF